MAAVRGRPSPGEARSLGGGAEAFHPVGLETSPQRRAADAESSRRFCELATRVLQRCGDGLPFTFGESQSTGRRKDRCFAETLRAVLQRSEPGAKTLQSIAYIAVLPVDRPSRRRIGIQQPAFLVEDDDALGDRVDHGAHQGSKGGGQVSRRADRFVYHWLVILIQNLYVQGFIRTKRAVRFVSR